jgi:hypothetical protein
MQLLVRLSRPNDGGFSGVPSLVLGAQAALRPKTAQGPRGRATSDGTVAGKFSRMLFLFLYPIPGKPVPAFISKCPPPGKGANLFPGISKLKVLTARPFAFARGTG